MSASAGRPHAPEPDGFTVLIDGYNVIKRSGGFEGLSLEACRRRLIQRTLAARWDFPVRRIVVVFDAPDSSVLRPQERLTVVYAFPNADAYIRRAVQDDPYPRRVAVVTDDREIVHTAKVNGSRCLTTAWLMGRTSPPNPPAKPGSAPGKGGPIGDKPTVSAVEARHITEELRRRWIKGINEDESGKTKGRRQ